MNVKEKVRRVKGGNPGVMVSYVVRRRKGKQL